MRLGRAVLGRLDDACQLVKSGRLASLERGTDSRSQTSYFETMTTDSQRLPRARRPALQRDLCAQGDLRSTEVANEGSHSGRPFLSMRALSGRSQSLEVFTMAASLAALL